MTPLHEAARALWYRITGYHPHDLVINELVAFAQQAAAEERARAAKAVRSNKGPDTYSKYWNSLLEYIAQHIEQPPPAGGEAVPDPRQHDEVD